MQITRRYAEFSAALVGLNESFTNDRVNQLLSQLQNEVENFILRMAAEFPQRKEQLVFLVNNYDMMLAVIMVCHRYYSTTASRNVDSILSAF
jgi:vacuolar protein sorting-associated protein 52